MATASNVLSSSVSTDSWEQLIEDGRKMGQVHWLFQSENGPLAGLWKIDTVEGAEIPYRVTTNFDSFHVIEGDGEMETPDGEKIQLTYAVRNTQRAIGARASSIVIGTPLFSYTWTKTTAGAQQP